MLFCERQADTATQAEDQGSEGAEKKEGEASQKKKTGARPAGHGPCKWVGRMDLRCSWTATAFRGAGTGGDLIDVEHGRLGAAT